VEVLVFGGFVAWYIWQLQASYFFAWLVFPVGCSPVSWFTETLLKQWDGGRQPVVRDKTLRARFCSGTAGLFLAGILLGALHRPAHHLLVPKHFFGYMSFCLLQQVG